MKHINILVLSVLLIVLLASVSVAGTKDNYTLYAQPTQDAKVVIYHETDFLDWRVKLIDHMNDNPLDRLEIKLVYPSGWGISSSMADNKARFLLNRVMNSLLDKAVISSTSDATYGYNSVASTKNDCRYVAIFHPPIVSLETINKVAKDEVNKVKRSHNGVYVGVVASGQTSGQATIFPVVGFTSESSFGGVTGFNVAAGAKQGEEVFEDGDENLAKISTFDLYGEFAITFKAYTKDDDDEDWFLDLEPAVVLQYVGLQMDDNGDFGMVRTSVNGALGVEFGWASPSKNFIFKISPRAGAGPGYVHQSDVRPSDPDFADSVIGLNWFAALNLEFLF